MATAHALHNEEVCDHLHSLNKYFDWVVTTAFYSALHFAEGKIFPLREYETFDEYYEGEKEDLHYTKHKAMYELVRVHVPLAAKAYRGLMDSCFNARYKDYDLSEDEAKTARGRMAFIKKECLTSAPGHSKDG